MIAILFAYGFLSLLTYFYYRSAESRVLITVNYIVVLSASTDYLTRTRVMAALRLTDQYPNAVLVACGKEKCQLMKKLVLTSRVQRYILENSSTNTLEDAIYSKKLIKSGNLLLVTHPSHARRSLHTFEKIYGNRISVKSAKKFTGIDSCLLPTGWIFSLINLTKDFKYNSRI